MIEAVFRAAVGRPYEFVELRVSGQDAQALGINIDEMSEDLVGKIGNLHRDLGIALSEAYEKGYEAAKAALREGLGATVLSEAETPTEEPQEAPAGQDVPVWKRAVKAEPKVWEQPAQAKPVPQGMDDF